MRWYPLSMKIAMIGQKGIPATFGGVERHVQELSEQLVARGHEVTVYSRPWYAPETGTSFNGIAVVPLWSFKSKHFDTISHTLLATLHAMRHKHSIIHYHGVGPALLSWIPRYFAPDTTVIATFHSIDRKHKKWGLIARWFLRLGEWAACTFPHHTIAVSRTIEQYARDVYDRDTVYIPNSVNIPAHGTNPALLKEWSISSGNYILVVSRLIPHKGIHYVMEAFKNIEDSEPDLLNNKKLVIVGDGYYTGDYVRQLTVLADTSDNIIMTGFQSGEKLAALFEHASLMVHASDNEGMPITVLEGMSNGLPILLSDIPEHRDLVGEKTCFFLHGNVSSLTSRLKELLRESPTTLAMYGKANRTAIDREYTWAATMEKILLVYSTAHEVSKVPSTVPVVE